MTSKIIGEPHAQVEAPAERTTRVVIAEDETIVAMALKSHFERYGYEVLGVAGTGTEALELIRQNNPDVVMMDVRMPDMDGLEATRQLMAKSPVCVIVLTAYVESQREAEEAGAMLYILKPIGASRIPVLLEIAQQRFQRYLQIRQAMGSHEAAMPTWLAAQTAVRILAKKESISEDLAFEQIQRFAEDYKMGLKEAAERMMNR